MRRGLRILLWSLAGLFVLAIAAGAVVADAYLQAYHTYKNDLANIVPQLDQARQELSQGLLPSADPFDAAASEAEQAQADVAHARFTYRLTSHIPFFSRPIEAVNLGVDAANNEAQAAITMRDMVQGLLGPEALRGGDTFSGNPPVFTNGVVNVKLIQGLSPQLDGLVAHLQAADRDIRAIPSLPFVGSLAQKKADALAKSTEAIRLAQRARSAIGLLPSFLGADGPRTYFFAMQNSADQRATGGAVLGYAFLTIDNGQMSLEPGGSIQNAEPKYGFPGIKLPAAVDWYLKNVPKQFPRLSNLNFTPDFPSNAQAWAALLGQGAKRHIDGAIAVDPVAVAQLLGSKKIHLPVLTDPISGSNLVQVAENQQYFLPHDDQLLFPAQLIAAAWPVLKDLHPFLRVVRTMGQVLGTKNIQIWSADADQEALLRTLGWDGSVKIGTGDHLQIGDNKLRSGKTDYYTKTTIGYDVTVDASGSITSSCTVTLDNLTPKGLPQGIVAKFNGPDNYALNDALLGLYAPAGATLTSESPPGQASYPPHQEGDAEVFTREVMAVPGKPGVAVWKYTVPGVVQTSSAGHVYTLTIQHQPLVNPAAISVSVTLPIGSVVRSAPGWQVSGSVVTYTGSLTKDLTLQIVY